MANLKCFLIIFVCIWATGTGMDLTVDSNLDGPHVCKKRENFPVEVVTTELQSYQERASVWCFNVPPRCSTYRLRHKVVNKTQTLTKTRIVRDCCEGYKRNPNGNGCIPECTQSCHHGKCVAPETCKCDHGYGGPSCDIICRCLNNSSCDPDTGRCICSPGWTGADCSQPCAPGYYGMGCKEKCPEIFHGNENCDHITGAINCRAGYIGLTCEHPCPTGRYGPGCTLKCSCENGGECNHISGQCQCLPGWTGANCNTSCPTDYYGPNCSKKCRCQNYQGCRKNDGLCICLPGWMGTRCDEICPEGFYGQHCMSSCQCPSQNFVCQAALGCVCRKGFSGENCDVRTMNDDGPEQRVQEADTQSSHISLIWGIAFAIIFVSIVAFIIFYYRRRVSNLKTEIQHVQYISDSGQGWQDRHNFDNPVYGMQSSEARLLNNLRPKMNNLNCNGDVYADDSNASSKAGTYSLNYNHEMLAKNLNADLTNPNVYNSIEDPLKEEHVYDEIRQKEGYKDPDEYDHLDYSRPSTSQKPHYHPMNETILNINQEEEKPTNFKTMSALLQKSSLAEANENADAAEDDSICDNMDEKLTGTPSSL